jgi:hypothetical protein
MKSGSSFARRPFISTAVAGDYALSRSLTASAKQKQFRCGSALRVCPLIRVGFEGVAAPQGLTVCGKTHALCQGTTLVGP